MDRTHPYLIIPEALHGSRMDAALAKLLPEYSRSQISTWLKAGLITYNRHTIKPKDKALADAIILLPNPWPPVDAGSGENQAESMALNIVYEDDTLLVINKPAGLVVHPGAGNWSHTLLNGLLHHAPNLQALPRAGIVHRLDKDTTGLMVVAKTLSAQTDLVRQLQTRSIQRHYFALTIGQLIAGSTIKTFYGRHPKNRLKMAVCKAGKEAITHYRIEKRFRYFTLLDVALETGRTHQIRVHMAHIHHPIVGDALYGSPTMKGLSNYSQLLQTLIKTFNRQALHAATLTLHHPKTSEIMTWSAPLPDDFKQLLDQLEQEDAKLYHS